MIKTYGFGFVIVLAVGCSSSGSEGNAPDAATPDAAMPDAMRIKCQGGTKLGDSYYTPMRVMLDRDDAISLCSATPGAHLVTFETLEEIAAVRSLGLTSEVWTGISQSPSATAARADWGNTAMGKLVPLPAPFPWFTGEPNDGVNGNTTAESHQEDFSWMNPDGTFNDGRGFIRLNALCECTPTL